MTIAPMLMRAMLFALRLKNCAIYINGPRRRNLTKIGPRPNFSPLAQDAGNDSTPCKAFYLPKTLWILLNLVKSANCTI
jgi:hypothetical protein